METIQKLLFSYSDEKYARFQRGLIPTVDFERIIGVRVPIVRKIAKSLDDKECQNFLSNPLHYYLEENYLHAFLVEKSRDYDECIRLCNEFLPFVDNWAVCDSLNPKIFAKNRNLLESAIEKWLESEHEFTVRFGIKMLMTYFLGNDFDIKYSEMVVGACRDDYYISMMAAWYFATALAKNFDFAIRYLEDFRLDAATHNRTIKKAVESYRIDNQVKSYIKSLYVSKKTSVD